MDRREKSGICWLEFEKFRPYKKRLIHGVLCCSASAGGEPLESLNFAENSSRVAESLKRVRSLFSLPEILIPLGVHGDTVSVANRLSESPPVCDGLMTQQKMLPIGVRHADCQAAIFYDPRRHALATVHCGWRGNCLNIYQQCIDQLGSDPADLLVGISPSLGPDHAEFIHWDSKLSSEATSFIDDKSHVNLWAWARSQLESAGILPHNIEIAQICSHCHKESFYSYRRDGNKAGRNLTFACLI